ncbi:UPF0481 protein [Salix suchowensis]|nr:UPF0481 protein [Salix suchowensis]
MADQELNILIPQEANSHFSLPHISKVPRLLRQIQSNQTCYDPSLVSIGPYHHGKPELRDMEMLKVTFTSKFVDDSGLSIQYLYGKVAEVQFARMMFIDGCFILQFMHCLNGESEKLEMSDRQIFHVKRDLLLLENQLPFAVLDSLRKQRYKNLSESNEIINDFLSLHIRSSSKPIPKWVPIALTTLGLVMIPILFPLFLLCFIILACHVFFSYRRVGPFRYSKNVSLDWSPPPKKTQPEHLLQLLYYKSMYHYSKRNQKKTPPGSRGHGLYYSAKNLKKSGIRFRPRWTGAITDLTESLLLNLVAYESAVALDQQWVSSYILFMDSLIDDAEDVEELRSNGIIINYLGADQKVANLFKAMGESMTDDTYDTAAYNDVKMAINKQCDQSTLKRWVYKWKTTWTFITVLGASFGLCLTATQTYYTRFPPK